MATEWSSVTLTCTVTSTFTLYVVWGRVGGALPSSHQSYTNEVCESCVTCTYPVYIILYIISHIIQGVATLIIPAVRHDDIGNYYFNVSYIKLATGIIYHAATHTQLSISRKLYKIINVCSLFSGFIQ